MLPPQRHRALVVAVEENTCVTVDQKNTDRPMQSSTTDKVQGCRDRNYYGPHCGTIVATQSQRWDRNGYREHVLANPAGHVLPLKSGKTGYLKDASSQMIQITLIVDDEIRHRDGATLLDSLYLGVVTTAGRLDG